MNKKKLIYSWKPKSLTSKMKEKVCAEEYAIYSKKSANAGIIVYGKYNNKWSVNPVSCRHLIKQLLGEIEQTKFKEQLEVLELNLDSVGDIICIGFPVDKSEWCDTFVFCNFVELGASEFKKEVLYLKDVHEATFDMRKFKTLWKEMVLVDAFLSKKRS